MEKVNREENTQENVPGKKKLAGRVTKGQFFSTSLGIEKTYRIYLPPGYAESNQRYPVVYLFRGHEDEWFNPGQDDTRGGSSVEDLANELIGNGEIGEMIIVGVGLTSEDNQIHGLGVNFLNPGLVRKRKGIGSGQFENFFVKDLIGHIDTTYRTLPSPDARALDGFSLGGFSSLMFALKYPHLFTSIGSYDGSFMFYNLQDPRIGEGDCRDHLWLRDDSMFAPAFRPPGKKKYDREYMLTYSVGNILENYPEKQKQQLSSLRFFITCAAYDGFQGNRDRSVHLMTLLQLHGLQNSAPSLILANDALHNWKFADLHLRKSLPFHSASFGYSPPTAESMFPNSYLEHLEVISIANSRVGGERPQLFFHVYKKMKIRVEILTSTEKVIRLVLNKTLTPGNYQISWDGKDQSGRMVSSGVYTVRMITPEGILPLRVLWLQ